MQRGQALAQIAYQSQNAGTKEEKKKDPGCRPLNAAQTISSSRSKDLGYLW